MIDYKDLLKKYFFVLVALTAFAGYWITIAPGVIQIDAGELAAVQATLGIAHPTGYPLFTILGYIFLQFPLFSSKIFQSNFLSAIYCAWGVYLLTRSIYTLLSYTYNSGHYQSRQNKINTQKNRSSSQKAIFRLNEFVILIITGTAGLSIAFSKTFWFQSTSVEVYSLHILLLSFIIRQSVTILTINEKVKPGKWLFLAFFTALGFTNHMTTILIIPAIGYLFFSKEGFNKQSIALIIKMLLVFIPVVIVAYLYLPVRASMNPMINWGDPDNFERILRHISGKQYQVWIFSSFASAKKQFLYFIENLPSEYFFIFLILAVLGIVELIRQSRKIFYFTLLCFLLTVLYSINYDINDIDAYFLLAYISLGVFISFGFAALLRVFPKINFQSNWLLIFAVLVLGVQISRSFDKVDQSGTFVFEDYTKELMQSVEENSIIFSYQWDYFISASYYFQYGENLCEDVTIIDKELLRRSWYYNQLITSSPKLFDEFQPDVDAFLKALELFENGEDYNPQILEEYYQKIMTKLISTNIEKKNYFIGPELYENEIRRNEFRLPEGYKIIPHLLLFKVVGADADYVPAPDPNFEIRFPKSTNKYSDVIKKFITNMMLYRSAYEMQFNKPDRAKLYISKIKSISPGYQIPAQFRSLLDN